MGLSWISGRTPLWDPVGRDFESRKLLKQLRRIVGRRNTWLKPGVNEMERGPGVNSRGVARWSRFATMWKFNSESEIDFRRRRKPDLVSKQRGAGSGDPAYNYSRTSFGIKAARFGARN